MNESMCSQAAGKINAELSKSMGRYGDVMKKEVADALKAFCAQNEEFAQAVVQGGSFTDCMKAVSGCVKGSAISDFEAYGAAVRFYFPGAEIKVQMTIDLIGAAAEEGDTEEAAPDGDAVIIDLSEFF